MRGRAPRVFPCAFWCGRGPLPSALPRFGRAPAHTGVCRPPVGMHPSIPLLTPLQQSITLLAHPNSPNSPWSLTPSPRLLMRSHDAHPSGCRHGVRRPLRTPVVNDGLLQSYAKCKGLLVFPEAWRSPAPPLSLASQREWPPGSPHLDICCRSGSSPTQGSSSPSR